MEILRDGIYFKSIDRFFSWVQCTLPSYNYADNDSVKLSNVSIFADCKCNISIYLKKGNVFYVDANILQQSSKKKDMISSFLEIEKKLNDAYGKTWVKSGRLSWAFFRSASSRRIINNVVIEHLLYEHFDFCERITVRVQQGDKGTV